MSLPVTAIVDQMFGELEARGKGDWDHSALLTLIEERAGIAYGHGGVEILSLLPMLSDCTGFGLWFSAER